ncbi:MAG TPA: SIS domain-containing protein [Acidimicrobiales bacterium]|nr:SIS domain-containing protein [Acidimicrobiales bacterium]
MGDEIAAAIKVAADAVSALVGRSTEPIERAVELILSSSGRVIVTGLGKSGLVGAKIAATLTSTGTPASFVHAADALHGDSGLVRDGDVVIAISNSGETAEVCAFVELVQPGAHVIGISGCGGSSTLARLSDVSIDAGVDRECDPHDLAPTASTTVTMVLGDALAVGLMAARGFGPEDFAKHHPGGALGKRLT